MPRLDSLCWLWKIVTERISRPDRSGEDRFLENSWGEREPQVPPLRFAPVGMTKGRAALTSTAVTKEGTEPQAIRDFHPVVWAKGP